MTSKNKTLYEVLGVPRNAKNTDIGLAYKRYRSEMQKETSIPDPRGAAMAKMAYETLSDPDQRAEYDASLGATMRLQKKKKATGPAAIASAVAVVLALGIGYYFFTRSAREAARAEQPLTPQEIVQAVGFRLGRVSGALMTGEVRDMGVAVAIADNEMVTTCRAMAVGALLTVKTGELSNKADLARSNADLDICTLAVQGQNAGIKLRSGPLPGPLEKSYALVFNPAGVIEPRVVHIARSIENPKGLLLELKPSNALPNGTPVFDAHARLVGLVTTPHAFGEGAVVALGIGRIARARGTATNEAASAPEPAAARALSPAPAPTAAPRGGFKGTLVEQGFTTLWKEDRQQRMVEVLDNPKKGNIGDPIALWTLWSGRDSSAPHLVHCLVTYGPEKEVIVDYDQVSLQFDEDGYWSCALTRFSVDLNELRKGQYQFTIFVNGKSVAEESVTIERKFWTRDKWGILVIILGIGALFLVRRKKELGKYFG